MDQHGAPPEMLLEALCYLAYLLNHSWSDNIKDVPLSALMGITIETCVLLCFHIWQCIHCWAIKPSISSDSREEIGYICGISKHVGHCELVSLKQWWSWGIVDPQPDHGLPDQRCWESSAVEISMHCLSPRSTHKPDHKDYNGSSHNVMLKWLNGEVTTIPLDILAADNPITCV